MRFRGECFRAHNPNWSWTPLSSAGAALKGRRFNWPGLETLYLSLDYQTVFREVSSGFAYRLTPMSSAVMTSTAMTSPTCEPMPGEPPSTSPWPT